jgi:hypothetical protein
MSRVPVWCRPVSLLLVLSGCGGSSPSPTSPSTPSSFLTGSWSGTLTIQVNPGQPSEQPPTSGPTRWTFELMPQSNLQSFRATVRSDHPWLTMMTIGTTALTPGNTAPAQISTLGQFTSPRGCMGTFGSAGTAQATRIEADFTGTDCQQTTFTGTVILTKE